jgi:hypothetical protein
MILLTASQRMFIREHCAPVLSTVTQPLVYGNSVKAFSICKVRHSNKPLSEHTLIQDTISNYPGASNRCITTSPTANCYAFPIGTYNWRPVVFEIGADLSHISLQLLEHTIRDRYSASSDINTVLSESSAPIELFGMQKVVLVSTRVAPSYAALLEMIAQ